MWEPTIIPPVWRNILLLCVINWCWILGSVLYEVTPVQDTNEFAQTIAHLTWPPQTPEATHEAIRFTVAHQVAAGNGFTVPEGLENVPDVVKIDRAKQGELNEYHPRFSPLYGYMLAGLVQVFAPATAGGEISYLINPLPMYRLLTLIPALIAGALLVWSFGLSVNLRGLKDIRWWYIMLPALIFSPLSLRATFLNELYLAAALLWTGCYFLNSATFALAKDKPWQARAIGSGALMMLASGLVPLGFAAVLGFGGVLLTHKEKPLIRLGSFFIGSALVVGVVLVLLNMMAFDKLLPLLAYESEQEAKFALKLFTDLLWTNGLLWMFPVAALGIWVLASRILRTQDLEEQDKVDLFRAGQGAFHWGAYWTLLAALGIAIVDAGFLFGVPSRVSNAEIHRLLVVPFGDGKLLLNQFTHFFSGGNWAIFIPLMAYYCSFIFREPVLIKLRPWYHNFVRIGAVVWFFGAAQPTGGFVFPLIEAMYTWSLGVATYFPLGRLA